jgi:transposase
MARWGRDEGKERYWRRVLAQWQDNQPTTVRAFCVAQGISQPLFYWWRREIQRRDRDRPQFLPVRVIPETPAPESDGSAIEVVLGSGRCLRVRPGFDRATLVRLLDVLGEGGVTC